MQVSATVLQRAFGLSSQETNYLLKEEGYLYGEPSAYKMTDKAAEFATEEDHHRGTGGYSHCNRYWTTLKWDVNIADELVIDDQRRRELRGAIEAAKRAAADEGFMDEAQEEQSSTADRSRDRALVMAVSAFLVTATAFGIAKAALRVRLWWTATARPSLRRRQLEFGGNLPTELEDSPSSHDRASLHAAIRSTAAAAVESHGGLANPVTAHPRAPWELTLVINYSPAGTPPRNPRSS
ncbi:hypothetical protein [Curtobacterium sp. AB7]|uniref:hypothetical protein n=1 Tax=Curtobacterium sp. AB7 TaxID=3349327 RepID=UPI00383249CE